jgi:hypothetical protein
LLSVRDVFSWLSEVAGLWLEGVADFVSASRETFSCVAGVVAFVSVRVVPVREVRVELRALEFVMVVRLARLDGRAATTPLPLNSPGLAVAATVGAP